MSPLFVKEFVSTNKCPKCPASRGGKSLCRRHLTVARLAWRVWSHFRRHQGLCVDCGEPAILLAGRCAEHLPLIHLVFSNLKAWLIGVHHGVAPQHLQAYLNEFTFRFNRRFFPFNAFKSLLGIGAESESATYAELYSGEWEHPSFAVEG